MVEPFRLIYYASMAAALICSCVYQKYDRRLLPFSILLSLSIITEILADVFHANKWPHRFFIYHIYIPVEFIFIAFYYASNATHKLVKKLVMLAAIIFPVICILLSASMTLDLFPGYQFNIEGILNILLALYSLFFLPVSNVPIFKKTIFWISLGLLFFHAEIFILNGTYNYLNVKQSALAKQLNDTINRSFNIIYYIFFSIGFVCGKQITK